MLDLMSTMRTICINSISLLTLTFLWFYETLGQEINHFTKEIEVDKYYPVNQFIKRNKIKLIIDSSEFKKPEGYWIDAYDPEGRIIREKFTDFKELESPFVYKTKDDTLIRLRHNLKRELYSVEKFVYNSDNLIVFYQECRDYYFHKDDFAATVELFFYDNKNNLESKLHYHESEYKGQIQEQLTIDPNTIPLTDGIHYTRFKLVDKNKLVVGTHIIGTPEKRSVDSVLLDNKGRLIKYSSYVKHGSLGCMMGNNINRVSMYHYQPKQLTFVSTLSKCIAPLANYECLESSKSLDDKFSIIYDDKHLKQFKYGYHNDGEKYLQDKYYYEFYE